MSTEVKRTFKNAFTLTEQELRRIYDILFQQMNHAVGSDEFTTVFKLKYKNDFTAEKKSVDEVCTESNGGVWEIQELTISMKERFTKIFITFSNVSSDGFGFIFDNFMHESIQFEIEGKDRDWVYLTSSQVEDRINSVKQFTLRTFFVNLISRLFLPLLFVFTATICIFGAIAVFFVPNLGSSKPSPALISLTGIPIGDMIILVIMLILLLVGIFTGMYFFPPYNFSWGDYQIRLQKRQSTGRTILTVIVIGMLINIIAGLITAYLGTRIAAGY